MTRLLFADNTALINFCLVGQLPLLWQTMNGRGTWSATVAIECAESALHPGCADLATVPAILGEPHAPETDDERSAVEDAWEYLRNPGDGPEKHLGEAETIALITSRGLNSIIVTDDTGAMRLARRHEVLVVTTVDLIVLATKGTHIEPQAAWDLIVDLQSTHGRFLPRAPATYADFLGRCGLISTGPSV